MKEDYDKKCNESLEYQNGIKNSETSTETSLPPEPVESSLPSKQIGPYPNATYHQSGLFSTVYKANDPSTKQLVTLKLTTPSQSQPPHDPLREARILKAATHTSIVPILSTHHVSGGHFLLVFPFFPLDLQTLVNSNHHGIDPTKIRTHLHAVFSALAHLHSLGIIHRDIKPSNILLASPSGPAYLADFGIAWMPGDAASEPSNKKITDVGTTCYRPPELLFGHTAYDCSLDLWAAGCVVAECLTTKTLFDAGALGSELALIQSIFKTLGTPNEEIWPEAKGFSDWGKMQFVEFPGKTWEEIIPDADEVARDFVAKLVRYQSSERLTATEVSGREEELLGLVMCLGFADLQSGIEPFFFRNGECLKI